MARFYHDLGDLERDLRTITLSFKPAAAVEVRDVAKDGNTEGRRNARRSSGTHAREYPGKFSAERRTPLEWEWGPVAEGQGLLPLERGNRNTPPHHDIAKAADQHGAPDLARRVQRNVLDRLFWP